MKQSNLDNLIRRYLTREATEEEKTKMEAWLDFLKKDQPVHAELDPEEQEKLFQKIASDKDMIKVLDEIREEQKEKSLRDWTIRGIASLVAVVLVAYAGWYFGSRSHRFEYASAGETRKVILEDGSLVWMQGNSNLVYYYDESDNTRYSELQGNGLFEVAKDADHPFVVKCGHVMIRVVGTSFRVESSQDSLVLRVLTGKVNVKFPNQESIDVHPNEKLVYTQGMFIKSLLSSVETTQAVAGTTYAMHFENSTLHAVLRKLEDKFNVKVELQNHAAGKCHLTVDLTDRSLERSLQMLTEVLDIDYQADGDKVRISGNGCN